MSSNTTPENDMHARVAVVEKELGLVYGIFQRFESALEKMTDVSMSVQKLLAVHDQRLTERERADQQLLESLDRRSDEQGRNVENVSRKMEEISMELRKQVKEELDDLTETVEESLRSMEKAQEKMFEKVDKRIETTDTKFKAMEDRIRALENWRWLLVGGGTAIGFIIAKWPFLSNILQ